MKIPVLATHRDCTGCSACLSMCHTHSIEMEDDEFGFFYPKIDTTSCVGCLLCQKVCPILNTVHHDTVETQSFAAYSLNNGVRRKSSSGGIFSEIATAVINRGGVVWGAMYGQDYNVVHTCINTIKDLEYLCGAKYVQSDLIDVFKQVSEQLREGLTVLFCGTPCQIYGLHGFLKCASGIKDEHVDHLFAVDFVCHSIPSPLAWKKYVQYRASVDNNGQYPLLINMRSKSSGWSKYRYSVNFNYYNTDYSVISNKDLYMKLFIKGFISRDSCENCRFKGIERISDITLGDCWGVWEYAPDMDDNKGTSLLLVRGEKGNKLFDLIKHNIKVQKISVSDAVLNNKAIVESERGKRGKNIIRNYVKNGDFPKIERLLLLFHMLSVTKKIFYFFKKLIRRS